MSSGKIPQNFSHNPSQFPHSYFRNLCIEIKKTIAISKDANELEDQMQKLINASKDMKWTKNKNKEKFAKQEGQKSIEKVLGEFRRYILDLRSKPNKSNPQDLLDSITQLQKLVESWQVL